MFLKHHSGSVRCACYYAYRSSHLRLSTLSNDYLLVHAIVCLSLMDLKYGNGQECPNTVIHTQQFSQKITNNLYKNSKLF